MTAPTPLWTDEQYAAYALGVQTEREHQEALARLAMEKHQAIIAAQAARIEELEGTLDQVATESDMIFDRGAQRLARIKELEAELATAKSEAAYWNYHYNEAVLEAQLAAAQHEPVTIDDRPHLISKAQFRGIEELGYAICRRVQATGGSDEHPR